MSKRAAVAIVRTGVVVGLAAALSAQRTWIVDWQNGPGTHFTDLPPALAAAVDGDTVLVRGPGGPGTPPAYTGGETSRGITLLGTASPHLQGSPFALRIIGLPAGRTFVMKGIEPDNGLIVFESCQGRIILEQVSFQPGSANALEIHGCAQVTVARCRLGMLPGLTGYQTSGLRCTQSVVALTESVVAGAAGQGQYIHGACFGAGSWPAVTATDSVLTLAGGQFFGGAAFNCGSVFFYASPAVLQTRGVLMVTGDAATRLVAGSGSPGPAITSLNGLLLHDADAQLVPVAPSPPINGSSQVLGWEAPYLAGAGVPAGNNAPFSLFAQSGDAAVLLGNFPGDPLSVPPFGVWWLSPGAFPVATTVVGATRLWQLTLPVPAGTPDGMPFAFQAVTASATNVALSNPHVLVLH